jgi:hypothetical protein
LGINSKGEVSLADTSIAEYEITEADKVGRKRGAEYRNDEFKALEEVDMEQELFILKQPSELLHLFLL